MQTKQTDNANLEAKLELRRYFMRRYHPTGACVFDACRGDKAIWTRLQSELTSAPDTCDTPAAPCRIRYFGVDVKPKRGVLKADSLRILAHTDISRYDVIDIDTHGLPWKHYRAMLPNIKRAVTVFLTLGHALNTAGAFNDKGVAQVLGIKFPTLKLPPAIIARVTDVAIPAFIWQCSEHGLEVQDFTEAERSQHARYFGLRLIPTTPHGA